MLTTQLQRGSHFSTFYFICWTCWSLSCHSNMFILNLSKSQLPLNYWYFSEWQGYTELIFQIIGEGLVAILTQWRRKPFLKKMKCKVLPHTSRQYAQWSHRYILKQMKLHCVSLVLLKKIWGKWLNNYILKLHINTFEVILRFYWCIESTKRCIGFFFLFFSYTDSIVDDAYLLLHILLVALSLSVEFGNMTGTSGTVFYTTLKSWFSVSVWGTAGCCGDN